MTGNAEMKSSRKGIYRIRGAAGEVFGVQATEKIREGALAAVCTAMYTLKRAAELKKEISGVVVEISEALADKTAREGLFGEDKGMGYCGTDVEYIPENAIELRYLNFDFTGFDNGQVKNYVKQAKTAKNCEKSVKNESVLRVFNGF